MRRITSLTSMLDRVGIDVLVLDDRIVAIDNRDTSWRMEVIEGQEDYDTAIAEMREALIARHAARFVPRKDKKEKNSKQLEEILRSQE